MNRHFKCSECKEITKTLLYQEVITGDVIYDDNDAVIYDDHKDSNYVTYSCPICKKELGSINIMDLVIDESGVK